MKKLSIILPVYNVEKFLPDCLDSIYNQDIAEDEFEIIAVIDGSPDNSKAVLLNYSKIHKNITLIEQENSGVSVARNNGLRDATGKYIWFIDPDDLIVKNCFKKIYESLQEHNADVFEFEYDTCEEDYEYEGKQTDFKVDGKDKEGATASGCLLVCRRDYLIDNNIFFNEELSYGEDYLWVLQVKYRKHINIFTNSRLYIYRQRKGSAMHQTSRAKTKKHFEDMLLLHELYAEEQKRCIKEQLSDRIINELEHRGLLCTEAALWYYLKVANSVNDAKELLKTLEQKGLYPYKFSTWNLFGKNAANSLKYRLITFLFPIKTYYLFLCKIYVSRLKTKK